jgi:hypothetical protein
MDDFIEERFIEERRCSLAAALNKDARRIEFRRATAVDGFLV